MISQEHCMSDEIALVEAEIADFEKQLAETMERIRALRAEEDPAKGIFRNLEIHTAQQEKLRLDFEIQYRQGKIKRLRFSD
ncbi:MAG: hypothetical protein HY795_09105 [Desulfovibrio sp.]|nr:hypothetical protein [Desulfovibrio sp.]MBI4961425.1 hypothetical protein [Desulfovibrio sp.]